MAEQTTRAAPTGESSGSGPPPDPQAEMAHRGRTTYADRALERLAWRYALEVPGVEPQTTGPEMIAAITPSLPQASVEQAGDRLRLDVRIAVAWGAHARAVASRVRSDVARRLAESTGKTVDRVDVTVAGLVRQSAVDRTTGRRRVE